MWRHLSAPVLLTAHLLGPPLAAAPTVTVPPGGLVRWPGEGVERCGLGEITFQPLANACWYAVDLLTPSEPITLTRWRGGKPETQQVTVGKYPYPVQRLTIEDDSKVNPNPQQEARIEREQAEVAALWQRPSGPRRFTLPLTRPLAKLPAGGRFGARRFFNGQPRSPHTGADYAAATGTPVRAAAPGTVVLAADHFFSGQSVYLDHGDGLFTVYFHLSEITVKPGQEVAAGALIGKVGATGRVTGPHLHFGVRWHGARIDPEYLLGRQPPRVLQSTAAP